MGMSSAACLDPVDATENRAFILSLTVMLVAWRRSNIQHAHSSPRAQRPLSLTPPSPYEIPKFSLTLTQYPHRRM